VLIEQLKFKKDYSLNREKNGLKPFLEIKKPSAVYQRLLKWYLLETQNPFKPQSESCCCFLNIQERLLKQ